MGCSFQGMVPQLQCVHEVFAPHLQSKHGDAYRTAAMGGCLMSTLKARLPACVNYGIELHHAELFQSIGITS